MPASDVTPVGLGLSLALVALAVALSRWQRLGLEATLVWTAARAIAQLLIIGAGLALVISPDAPLGWSWLWLAGMVLVAADVVRRRVKVVPRLLPLAVAAYAISGALTLGLLFGLGIFPLEPRTLVPLSGLMIGNSLTATVVAARRVVDELRDKRAEVEVRLALGQASRDAARPYLAAALRTALIPRIETTKAVGLVFLPGAMTGLILAGVDPIDAVLLQGVVMFLSLGASTMTTTAIGIGLVRLLFTPDHRLVRLEDRSDPTAATT